MMQTKDSESATLSLKAFSTFKKTYDIIRQYKNLLPIGKEVDVKYFIKAMVILMTITIFTPAALAEQTEEERFEVLCSEGNSTACFKMGERYRTVERDEKNALKFYEKACDAGYMTGCTNGGILLAKKSTPYSKGFKQARKMFDKACEAGEDPSCFNLGTLNYKEGRQKKAIKYYKKACGMGNQGGCAKEKRLLR